MQITGHFALPEARGVAFHIVTEKGVFGAKASEELLRAIQHPLSELGNAVQAIIMQYQMLDFVRN